MSDTTFQDTPLYAWLRANAWFLLTGCALVLGIILYRDNAPSWHRAAQEKSWDSFRAMAPANGDLKDLPAHLAEAKKDERIYPWFVFEATRVASEQADGASLALLKPELESLAQSCPIMVATPSGPQNMAAYLLSKLSGSDSGLPTDFTNPEPDGGTVEIVVSVNDTNTYTVSFTLYKSLAPSGVEALESWVGAGRFENQSARKVGVSGLTLNLAPRVPLEGEGDPAELLVERPYGLYHMAGVLSLMQLPGKAGVQDPNAIQILLQDANYQDGFSTVVGKASAGWEAFQAAIGALDGSATIKLVSARLL